MTYDDSLKLLSILTSAYPNFELKKSTVQVYAKCLEDIPFNLGQAAALSHITHSKYFPSIAELRETALKLDGGRRIPEPEEAWATVSEAIRKHGRYKEPKFACEAITKAVKQIGWWNLCNSEQPNQERTYFIRLYETYAKRMKDEFLEIPSVKAIASGYDEPLYLTAPADDEEFLEKYRTR